MGAKHTAAAVKRTCFSALKCILEQPCSPAALAVDEMSITGL